jgi:hypothetical protein
LMSSMRAIRRHSTTTADTPTRNEAAPIGGLVCFSPDFGPLPRAARPLGITYLYVMEPKS